MSIQAETELSGSQQRMRCDSIKYSQSFSITDMNIQQGVISISHLSKLSEPSSYGGRLDVEKRM